MTTNLIRSDIEPTELAQKVVDRLFVMGWNSFRNPQFVHELKECIEAELAALTAPETNRGT